MRTRPRRRGADTLKSAEPGIYRLFAPQSNNLADMRGGNWVDGE